jgi:hypothetical protein
MMTTTEEMEETDMTITDITDEVAQYRVSSERHGYKIDVMARSHMEAIQIAIGNSADGIVTVYRRDDHSEPRYYDLAQS